MSKAVIILVIALAAFADSQTFGASSRFGSRSRELFADQGAPAPAFGAPAFAPAPAPAFAAPAPAFAAPSPAFAAPAPAFAPAPSSFSGFAKPQITVVQRSFQQDESGQFASSFTGSDGASFQESGQLHPTNDRTDNVIVKTGVFKYTSPEGIPVEISYTADEYGFHPQGSSIPVAAAAPPTSFL